MRAVFTLSSHGWFHGCLATLALAAGGCNDSSTDAQAVPSLSTIAVSTSQISSGKSGTATLTMRDQSGAQIALAGQTVQFQAVNVTGGSTLSFAPVVDHQDGTYSSDFTGVAAGKGVFVTAFINGTSVDSAKLPIVVVTPGQVSLSRTAILPISASAMSVGQSVQLTLAARDAAGNSLGGGLAVSFVNLGTGTSAGTFSAVADNGDGTYTTRFTATTGGTATALSAQIAGAALTSAPVSVQVASTASGAAASTVVSSATSVIADGKATAQITVTLIDGSGKPIGGRSVSIGSSRGTGIDAVTPALVTTNSAGQAVFTVSSTTIGLATFTATDVSDSVIVQQTSSVAFLSPPASAANSSVAASPQHPTADGGTGTSVLVTLRDSNGNLLQGKGVTLASSRGPTDSVAPTSAMTNASGQATFQVSSVVAGDSVFTATDTTDSVILTQTGTASFVPGPAATALSTVVPSPTGVVADGTSTSTVVVTLMDAHSNLIVGRAVSLASSRTISDSILPASVSTNIAGQARFTVASTLVGTAILTATDIADSVTLTQTPSVSFNPGAASATKSVLALSPASITADGASTASVTVLLKDSFGNVAFSRRVTLTSSRGSADSITPSSAVADATGQATFRIASTTSGTAVLTATDTTDAVTVGQTATLTLKAGAVVAAVSAISGAPVSVPADGVTASTVVVTLKDKFLNGVAGKRVSLSSSRGISDAISPSTATTDSSGRATFTVTSLLAGQATLTATDASDSLNVTQQLGLTFLPGPASIAKSSLAASPLSTVANGVTGASVTVTLIDANSNPVPGRTVVINPSRGAVDTVTPPSGVTNPSGQVSFLVTSRTAGITTLSSTDTTDNVTLTQTPSVVFNPGPASTSVSTLSAGPTNVVANGSAQATVTVVLMDAFSNVISGKNITIASSRGATDNFNAPSQTTDATGTATFLVASTGAGAPVFTATDFTDSLVIAQTGSMNFIAGPVATAQCTIASSPATVAANGTTTSSITVTLRDQFNNPAIGKTVTVSSSRGAADTISPASVATNASGQAVFTVKSTTAGIGVFTPTDTSDGFTLPISANVTFAPGVATVAQSSATASPTSVVANGTSTSTITVTLKDQYLNAASGRTVTLTSSRGGTDTISPSSTTTSSTGVATFTVKSIVAGSSTLTAADTTDSITLSQTPTITFTAGPVTAANSRVAAGPSSVPANGSTATTVIVTLFDANNNPVSGKTTTVTSSRGASDTISPASATTNASGQATFTVTSLAHGAATLTGKDTTDTITATQTQSVVFSLSALQVSSFQDHACAVMSDHSVQCWGLNVNSQLGDATTTDRSTPVSVAGITTANQVAVGSGHSCALLSGGTVKCWGLNASGQIGDGTTVNKTAATLVTGISTATAIVAGYAHSCALLSTGAVSCWGLNANSQLGDGTTINRSTAVSVTGITTATSLSAQAYATCARLSNGGVSCWGYNGMGGLGDGTTTTRATAVAVTGITGVSGIGAGYYHTCAILTGGSAKCWGNNAQGQLGDGTTVQRLTPVAVTGVTTAAIIAGVGQDNTCAILSSKQLQCWGSNVFGGIGDGTISQRLTATNVTGITNAVAVGGGIGYACSILTDGSMRCWGSNPNGNLGNAVVGARNTVTAATGILSPSGMAAGFGHTCALSNTGTIQCWGSNAYGQLGDGTTTDRLLPVGVTGIVNAIGIAAGAYHTCALLATGAVSCWGLNQNGAIGDGTTTTRLVPTPASGITTATAISAGAFTTCALISGGSVKCWGGNAAGTVGDGTTTDRPTPTAVSGVTTAASISLANLHACAVLAAGTVQCWGDNSFGELGDGTSTNRSAPVAVTGLTGVAKVAVGGYHSCARTTGSAVKCWGGGTSGQLGNGTGTTSFTPVAVTGISTANSVLSGLYHSCALLSTQAMQCWGDNAFGEDGDATSVTTRLSPVSVSGVTTGAAAYGGAGYHSCVVLANGTTQCWGSNGFGQIGNGVAGDSHSPAIVLLQ